MTAVQFRITGYQLNIPFFNYPPRLPLQLNKNIGHGTEGRTGTLAR